MLIQNVRFGFANNSSSSHSIFFVPDALHEPGSIGLGERGYGGGKYEWDYFCLDTPELKADYFAVAYLNSLLSNGFSKTEAQRILKECYGLDSLGTIDHKSNFTFPRPKEVVWSGKEDLYFKFMEALHNYIVNNPYVVITGGNDNCGFSDFRGIEIPQLKDFLACGPITSNFVFRDLGAGWWLLFNPDNGFKTRMYLGNDFSQKEPEEYGRSPFPELVDMKITDYCPYGCGFCYQGSTPDGVHGDVDKIISLVRALREQGTLEVAIGGGEPTKHPYFVEILRAFGYNRGACPRVSFTTFNMDWVDDKAIVNAVNDHCSSFAVSSISQKALDRIYTWNNNPENKPKAALQVVPGTFSSSQFTKVAKFCHENKVTLTLLGFKETHRGQDYKRKHADFVVDFLKSPSAFLGKEVCPGGLNNLVCVDTAMVRNHPEILRRPAVRRLTHAEEGRFSMYIDAVALEASCSSYEMENAVKIDSCWEIEYRSRYGRKAVFYKNKPVAECLEKVWREMKCQ